MSRDNDYLNRTVIHQCAGCESFSIPNPDLARHTGAVLLMFSVMSSGMIRFLILPWWKEGVRAGGG